MNKDLRRIEWDGTISWNGKSDSQLEEVAWNGIEREKKNGQRILRWYVLSIALLDDYLWMNRKFRFGFGFGLNFRLLARRSFLLAYSSTSFYIYLFLISLIIIIITNVCCWFFSLSSSFRIQIRRAFFPRRFSWLHSTLFRLMFTSAMNEIDATTSKCYW